MKQLINVTDIVSYLFCPRKVYLKLVKKIKEPANKRMIAGFLKHKIFDIFSKNESTIVSNINQDLNEKEIYELYKKHISNIIQEVLFNYENMVFSFKIDRQDFTKETLNFLEKEINLRIRAIKQNLILGFKGRELWRNLKPKYLTEFEIISEELGLKGRIDRIKLQEEILPYELKTRKEIYESDKIQLAAYSLLLEQEFNKKIDKGVIETSSQQQEIIITEEDKNKVLEIAEKIRNMKEASFPSNFNKCENCRLRESCFDS